MSTQCTQNTLGNKRTVVQFTAIDGTGSVTVILVKHLSPLSNVRPQRLEFMQFNAARPISIKHTFTDIKQQIISNRHNHVNLTHAEF